MGSAGSKGAATGEDDGGAGPAGGDGCGSRGAGKRWRPLRAAVPGLACFCGPSSAPAAVDCGKQQKGRETSKNSIFLDEPEPVRRNHRWRKGRCLRFGSAKPGLAACSRSPSSGLDGNRIVQDGTSCGDPDDGSRASTQAAAITRASNSPDQSRALLGPVPDRTASGSGMATNPEASGAQSVFSDPCTAPNRGDDHVDKGSDGPPSHGRNGTAGHSVRADASVPSLGFTEHNVDVGASSIGSACREIVRRGDFEGRPSRRHRPQESLEGSVRFSRTLSVGRLRERVLRGPPFSDRLFGSTSAGDRLVEYGPNVTERRATHEAIEGLFSPGASTDVPSSSVPTQPASMPGSVGMSHDYASATRSREASNRDVLEHRSAFIERRRRIRSQVRALQQLANRVENHPGHDRSCVLCGQHGTGHCSCRRNNGHPDVRDDRNARSSISRIVMLAEALFEVLDEIHQQAVLLASRPSASSIGSMPAPKEVVERMPLRRYTRPSKHHNEEASQCYICLLEYEDGDYMRILPCRHEFHKTCVDKWLKEVHRICPLCRGDICTSY